MIEAWIDSWTWYCRWTVCKKTGDAVIQSHLVTDRSRMPSLKLRNSHPKIWQAGQANVSGLLLSHHSCCTQQFWFMGTGVALHAAILPKPDLAPSFNSAAAQGWNVMSVQDSVLQMIWSFNSLARTSCSHSFPTLLPREHAGTHFGIAISAVRTVGARFCHGLLILNGWAFQVLVFQKCKRFTICLSISCHNTLAIDTTGLARLTCGAEAGMHSERLTLSTRLNLSKIAIFQKTQIEIQKIKYIQICSVYSYFVQISLIKMQMFWSRQLGGPLWPCCKRSILHRASAPYKPPIAPIYVDISVLSSHVVPPGEQSEKLSSMHGLPAEGHCHIPHYIHGTLLWSGHKYVKIVKATGHRKHSSWRALFCFKYRSHLAFCKGRKLTKWLCIREILNLVSAACKSCLHIQIVFLGDKMCQIVHLFCRRIEKPKFPAWLFEVWRHAWSVGSDSLKRVKHLWRKADVTLTIASCLAMFCEVYYWHLKGAFQRRIRIALWLYQHCFCCRGVNLGLCRLLLPCFMAKWLSWNMLGFDMVWGTVEPCHLHADVDYSMLVWQSRKRWKWRRDLRGQSWCLPFKLFSCLDYNSNNFFSK